MLSIWPDENTIQANGVGGPGPLAGVANRRKAMHREVMRGDAIFVLDQVFRDGQ